MPSLKTKKKKQSTSALSLPKNEKKKHHGTPDAKTVVEVGQLTDRTRRMIKSHFKNIRQRIGSKKEGAIAKRPAGRGDLLPPLSKTSSEERPSRVKVSIVGGGKGGTAILNIFKEDPSIEIAGVADVNPKAPAIKLARSLGIPVAEDYHSIVKPGVAIVINVTGSKHVGEEIKKVKPRETELIEGLSAKLLWQLVGERRRRIKERERFLKEQEALYHLGLVIESIDSIKDAGMAVINYATTLTSTPAGSLAMFDERNEDMVLVAAKGFSKQFRKVKRWEIRKGGLTSYILNQKAPLVINDLTNYPDLNPLLLKEGVRALLVAPLTIEGRIVGILYVNDFKKRDFDTEEISLFSLLTVYAALTLERVKAIEEMRVLSITDGLTSLYNHRYLMGQMQKELQRALRHRNPLSVVMLDIDHFKSYNDRFGHIEGNKILKAIARLLVNTSRITDTVGRFGGEEFCLILPDIKKDGAAALAKRILHHVASLPAPRKVTISAGVASFPGDGKAPLELIKKADKRLYKAKQLGRNRVCS